VSKNSDLENWVRGCSKSLKMAPFDTSHMTIYWSANVNIALSGTVFVLCDVENWVRGCSKSLKMAPFDTSHMTIYWSANVNIALSGTVLCYLTLNNIVTLKSGSEVIQNHSPWYHSKA